MPAAPAPASTVRAPHHMVASADHLATSAGIEMWALGGNAVDAAIACNAAIAVTAPHLCGMGGDLFALVHVDDAGDVTSGGSGARTFALNASGRAGSGADPDGLRAEGRTEMPFKLDVRAVTVPGCVDGWIALHERFGSLPLEVILGPARRLAVDGFPASPLLVGSLRRLDADSRSNLAELATQATTTGAVVRRPGVALALAGVSAAGRDSFYRGAFGDGLIELGGGLFTDDDVAAQHAEWTTPLTATAFGVDLHTIGPNSQGYLTLGAAILADRLDLPDDPDDERWAHLLVEAATAAGFDRPDRLHEHADGDSLVEAISGRLAMIGLERSSGRTAPASDGDTTYLCTAGHGPDGRRMGVSLIQSNASGFGSHLVEPHTGINLHNRGLGFNLVAGHAAEYGPRRRPPHTLSPALATRNGRLAAVVGTMGGDAQPQILLQILTRLFRHGQSPAVAINAARWALDGPTNGFDTWTGAGGPSLGVEGQAPAAWVEALRARGHRTTSEPAWDSSFGHAHAIVVEPNGMYAGAADPRAVVGSAAGS
jgi:gamma-glutamyltranspeptidase / glutathione hydrolase